MLEGLDFVRKPGAFEVSYRASADPQNVSIVVETQGRASRRSGPVCLRKVLDMINFGAAGGRHFAPELCRAERTQGPWDGEDAFGPTYVWTLKVQGVAPEFLRLVVEHLRRCGWDQPVTRMRIVGALPPDASAMSVRTADLQRWLDDTRTYPETYVPERFRVRPLDGTGAMYKVEFAEPLNEAQRELMQAMCARWLAATATLVGMNGEPLVRTAEHLEQMLPSFAIEAQSFAARMNKFGHGAAPSAALLINMLSRFHVTQAAIANVELMIEGLRAPAPAKSPRKKKPVAKKSPPEKPAKKKAQYNSAPRRLVKKAAARSSRSAKTRSKRPSSPKASR